MWTNLRRLGVQPSTLEDAAHDVFMTVHRRLDHFEGRSSLRTWLLAITRRVAFRHRRTLARTRRRRDALAHVDPIPRLGDDLEEYVARREAEVALQRFLDDLDDGKREAFVLGEIERLGREELGAALGINPSTAYSRLRAARERFSATFGEHTEIVIPARQAASAPDRSRRRVAALLAIPGVPRAAATATSWLGVGTALGLAGLVAARVAVGDGSDRGRDEVTVVAPSGPRPARTRPPRARPTESPGISEPTPRADPARTEPPAAPTAKAASVRRPDRSRDPRPTRPATVADSSASPEPASNLREEAALIRSARAALGTGAASRALAAVDQHAARFADGVLVEERDALRVQALCRLSRHDEAGRARAEFDRRHPHSAHDTSIADACSTKSVPNLINSPPGGDSTEQ